MCDTDKLTCNKCGGQICSECKVRLTQTTDGKWKRSKCDSCRRAGKKAWKGQRSYTGWRDLSLQIRTKIGHCEECGFLPEDLGQLEVDHIDGNRHNNDLPNLQVLCCNCHRLKTIRNKDRIPYKYRG
jgi:5-methylcytosine-specific restriction endonuclease McrA